MSYTLLIEEHAKLTKQKLDEGENCKIPLWELKILLADLCYLFSRDDDGYGMQKLYVLKYLSKYRSDYIHNIYVIISFLIKLIDIEKQNKTSGERRYEERLIGIISDIVKAQVDVATQEYFVDQLSGLYTYNYLARLESELETDVRVRQEISVALFDLDNLKTINDMRGHNYGNVVIQQFANALLECTRPEDTCIRFGGDEFLVVFKHGKPIEHDILLSRLSHNTRIRFFDIEYSSGFATGIIKKNSISELIERADKQMYQQKQLKKPYDVSAFQMGKEKQAT